MFTGRHPPVALGLPPALDWAVVALYFAAVAAIAVWAVARERRGGAETADGYFLAGRNVGWFVVGASLFASNIGSEHLVGLAGSGASTGMVFGQLELQASLILLLLGWLFVPFYVRSGVFTMPEFLERRYSPAARWYLSVVSILGYVLTKISVTIATTPRAASDVSGDGPPLDATTEVVPGGGVSEETFAGHRCLRLSNGVVSAHATLDVGPRVLGFALDAGPLAGVNAFADAVGTTLDGPGGRPYHLRGGHRLWLAPEDPPETYRPDDDPPDVEVVDGSDSTTAVVRASPAPHPRTGVRTSICVSVLPGRPEVAVTHEVVNGGRDPVRLAPWAITQLPTGGTAVVPLAFCRADFYGVLPDRRLVLWPYTRLDDSRLTLGARYVLVRADADAADAVKVGTGGVGEGSGPGWLAYVRPGAPVFVKRSRRDTSATYPDGGCSAEVYANGAFCELETLGPSVWLRPGGTATHVERWALSPEAAPPATDEEAHALAVRLGLSRRDPS